MGRAKKASLAARASPITASGTPCPRSWRNPTVRQAWSTAPAMPSLDAGSDQRLTSTVGTSGPMPGLYASGVLGEDPVERAARLGEHGGGRADLGGRARMHDV